MESEQKACCHKHSHQHHASRAITHTLRVWLLEICKPQRGLTWLPAARRAARGSSRPGVVCSQKKKLRDNEKKNGLGFAFLEKRPRAVTTPGLHVEPQAARSIPMRHRSSNAWDMIAHDDRSRASMRNWNSYQTSSSNAWELQCVSIEDSNGLSLRIGMGPHSGLELVMLGDLNESCKQYSWNESSKQYSPVCPQTMYIVGFAL